VLRRLRRPNFLGGPASNLLVATTIAGDTPCRSTNVDYRVDRRGAVSGVQFVGEFVMLP
jgi:hypothetical protein